MHVKSGQKSNLMLSNWIDEIVSALMSFFLILFPSLLETLVRRQFCWFVLFLSLFTALVRLHFPFPATNFIQKKNPSFFFQVHKTNIAIKHAISLLIMMVRSCQQYRTNLLSYCWLPHDIHRTNLIFFMPVSLLPFL